MRGMGLIRTLPILGLGILVILPAGCGSNQPAVKSAAPEQTKAAPDREADEILASVTRSLSADANISVYPAVLKQLNQYLERRATAAPSLSEEQKGRLASLLGADGANEASKREFIPADAEYLKSTLLLRAIAKSQMTAGEPDLALAIRLSDWLARELSVAPTGWQASAPPMETLIRGSGDAYERLWILCGLFRQANLTGCVVGIPDPANKDAIIPWLGGVILKDEVHLFDPRLATPILSSKGGVATLTELAANPGLAAAASKTTLNQAIPRESIKEFSILLPLEPSMLAPRMKFLQDRLSGENRVNLTVDAEAWVETASQALAKVPKASGVRVWNYPTSVVNEMLRDRRAVLASMNILWLTNPKSARLAALRGQSNEAIESFVRMDLENLAPSAFYPALASRSMPPELRRVVASRTRQDVLYFGGLAQGERPGPEARVSEQWFDRYLAAFGSSQYRPGDGFDWRGLTNKIATSASSSAPSPGKRLVDLEPSTAKVWIAISECYRAITDGLTQPAAAMPGATIAQRLAAARDAIEEVRAVAGLRKPLEASPGLLASLAKRLETESLSQELVAELATALAPIPAILLNHALPRRDLYDSASFAAINQGGELAIMLALSADQLTAGLVQRRNRMLLDAAFPTELAEGTPIWLAGALRGKAEALRRTQKSEAAIRLLRDGHPELLPLERESLAAQAERWSIEEKVAREKDKKP